MSTVYDQPVDESAGQDERDRPWAGPQGPAGPGGPERPAGPGGLDGPGGYGEHGGPGGGRGRPSRRRHALLAVGSVVAAGALAFGGLGVANAMAASPLTTSQIASKVDPGLVDVVSTLGYQGGEAAGTGMVLTSSGEVL